jgi:hypothetical protein
MMHGREKSDSAIVAEKPTNKVVSATAEPVEPRAGAKGNASQQSTLRTQCRKCVSQALERIRQVRRHSPKVGAVCGNSARTDLGGGRSVMTVPTALRSEYFRVRPGTEISLSADRHRCLPECRAIGMRSAGRFRWNDAGFRQSASGARTMKRRTVWTGLSASHLGSTVWWSSR